MKTSKLKFKANRVPTFDHKGEERPYSVVIDTYDEYGSFLENGTDWTYFATEKEAELFCLKFNNQNYENKERNH